MKSTPKFPASKKPRATFRAVQANWITPELREKLRELPIMSSQRAIDSIGRLPPPQQPFVVDRLVAGAPTIKKAVAALRAQAVRGE